LAADRLVFILGIAVTPCADVMTSDLIFKDRPLELPKRQRLKQDRKRSHFKLFEKVMA
jgi:hypothetical protein